MIHYHGAKISGGNLAFKALSGRHALVSFEYDCVHQIADMVQSFVLDNGAFSAWGKGVNKTVDSWNKYYAFVERWMLHPAFDWAIIPDAIDGDEKANDELLTAWPLGSYIGIPVWHMHENIGRLKKLADSWPRIAIGSSVQYRNIGTSAWWSRMDNAMREICVAGRPQTRLHGLRMLNPEIFTRLPLSSADSANAGINAGSINRFGQYRPASAELRAAVIMDRIEAHQSASTWDGYNEDQ